MTNNNWKEEFNRFWGYNMCNQVEKDTVYSKVYNGYIWVFDNDKLITMYKISNLTDLLVIRK